MQLEGLRKGSSDHSAVRTNIYDKLSTRTKRLICDRLDNYNPSIDEITSGLLHQIRFLRIDSAPRKESSDKPTSQKVMVNTVQASGQNGKKRQNQNQHNKSKCRFCNLSHSTLDCRKFQDVSSRRQQALQLDMVLGVRNNRSWWRNCHP